eukprot:30011-Chlamydomonas_euryale.AAC.1
MHDGATQWVRLPVTVPRHSCAPGHAGGCVGVGLAGVAQRLGYGSMTGAKRCLRAVTAANGTGSCLSASDCIFWRGRQCCRRC